jgi:serine O-acetyltransferase
MNHLNSKVFEFNLQNSHSLKPKQVIDWVDSVRYYFFPCLVNSCYGDGGFSLDHFALAHQKLQLQLQLMLLGVDSITFSQAKTLSSKIIGELENIFDTLLTDLDAIYKTDPAATDKFMILMCYPGFLTITYYRIAHIFYMLNLGLIARIVTEHAHSLTGIDIHPGAKIGSSFCIDHGTGIVIGETCVIGSNVKVYQGVTLGALSVTKDLANKQRHPKIEDNVIIYAGATILGGQTVVGSDTIIGGNTWITSSVNAGSKVYFRATDNK